MMKMMIKTKMGITQLIFKRGPSYFARQQIYIIPKDNDNDNNYTDDNDNNDNENQYDEDDDKNKNGHNSAYFQARISRFCIIVDIYNTYK